MVAGGEHLGDVARRVADRALDGGAVQSRRSQISRRSGDAAVLDVSGYQRARSQRTAYLALAAHVGLRPPGRQSELTNAYLPDGRNARSHGVTGGLLWARGRSREVRPR